MEGDRSLGEKGRCMEGGGGGRGDRKRGGKREKKGKLAQHFTIFSNQNSAKRREPTKIKWEPGIKGAGRRKFKLLPPPPSLQTVIITMMYHSCEESH